MTCTFTVNGTHHSFDIDPMTRLLDVLREHLSLTGTKEGCGEGECGACSVFVDGRLVNSCLMPVIQVEGAEIQTIEYIRETAAGKRLVQTFAELHAVQCGFCTPGMIMAAVNLLRHIPQPEENEIRTAIAGNICRCTGYDMIVEAIEATSRQDGSP